MADIAKKELLLLLLYVISLCTLVFSLVVYSTLCGTYFSFFLWRLDDEKRIMQAQTALQYKPLLIINRSENGVKKIQSAAYNFLAKK